MKYIFSMINTLLYKLHDNDIQLIEYEETPIYPIADMHTPLTVPVGSVVALSEMVEVSDRLLS